MDLKELASRAKTIRDSYNQLSRQEGFKTWGPVEHAQGLVGDVGDLMKLVMGKEGYWFKQDEIDEKLAHELADCLYSIMVIADELHIDLEKSFLKTMDDLQKRIDGREVIGGKE